MKVIANQKLKLICKEFISVNHYMSYRVIKKNKKTLVMAYKPEETKNFEKSFGKYIKEEINKQGWIKPTKDKLIIMDTTFYFPRVDMDAQNYFKSICDIATNCGVWEDDNVVMERVNRIYYDSNNPRIEITIYESDYIGIFDNKEDMDLFISKCKTCNRYKRNCSILKNALEGRIQEEIVKVDKWNCNKFKEIKIKNIKKEV